MNSLKDIFSRLSKSKDWVLKASLKKKLIIFVVLLAGGWFGGSRILAQNQQQPQYQTAQVEKGTLITSVSASGTVSQGSSVGITTAATGIVSNVYVADGDIVSQGDKIADITLDIASQQKQAAAWSSYLSAKNSLVSSQNNLNSLNSAMWKTQQTFINGAVARGLTVDDPTYIQQSSDWALAENQYKNQKEVIVQAQAALNSAWLSYVQLSSVITAPISGRVSGLTLTSGLPINGEGALGAIVLEQGQSQVNVNLTEIDVTKVAPGQKVTLTLDVFPDKTFTGKIVAINTNGSVSSGVTTYPATIAFDTTVATIYPNMAANATIITDVKNNVILVPSAAVQTTNGQSTVRVMREGQITPVTVEIGDSNDTQTEIVSGINEGDTVITVQTGATTPGSTGATSPFGNTRGGFGGTGGGGVQIQRR